MTTLSTACQSNVSDNVGHRNLGAHRLHAPSGIPVSQALFKALLMITISHTGIGQSAVGDYRRQALVALSYFHQGIVGDYRWLCCLSCSTRASCAGPSRSRTAANSATASRSGTGSSWRIASLLNLEPIVEQAIIKGTLGLSVLLASTDLLLRLQLRFYAVLCAACLFPLLASADHNSVEHLV